MGISSPEQRIWWREPLHRFEIIWITVAFLWGLVMFFAMIYWHIYGKQNLSNEAYRVTTDAFTAKVEAMVKQYKVGEHTSGLPIVRPPPGSDVYLLGRTFEWYPIVQLEQGKDYRLHISSADVQHGFSLQPINLNLQIHPGYDLVMTVTPDRIGEYSIICNEYCGLGHHAMVGRVIVVAAGAQK
jgi:cytochrome c oxidase subunit 2